MAGVQAGPREWLPPLRWWLAAAAVSAAVLPAATLVLAGHLREVDQRALGRAALSDVLLDAPLAADGLLEDYGPLVDAVAGRADVSEASPLLAGPALLRTDRAWSVARLAALAGEQARLAPLEPLVVAGGLEALGRDDRATALGEELALALGLGVGDELAAVSLAPGPEALGSRRRSLRVAALLRSGLVGFDRHVAIVRLGAARELLAPGPRISGLEVFARVRGGAPGLAVELDGSVAEPLRAREAGARDWPERDAIALSGLGQSLLVATLALVALALALTLRYRREVGLGAYLRRALPLVGLSAGAALVAAAALASTGLRAGPPSFGAALPDLARLGAALVVAVLLAPALSGRLRGTAAAAALAAAVALATASPAAGSVLARLGREAGERAAGALGTTVSLASSSVEAVVSRGAEVAPARLRGLDPARPESERVLEALTGRPGLADRLTGPGAPPPPWSPEPGIDSLLEELALHGSRVPGEGEGEDEAGGGPERQDEAGARGEQGDEAEAGGGPEQRDEAGARGEQGDEASEAAPVEAGEAAPGAEAARPGIVLGEALARRLGAEIGDEVRVAAAPEALASLDEATPPWPRTFRVEGLSRVGLRSADDRMALVGLAEVRALGGVERGEEGLDRTSPSVAAAAFERRARQAGVAGALQLVLCCLLLGAAGHRGALGPRSLSALAAWVCLGLLLGALMGGAEAARGLVGIGEAIRYEVAPRGTVGPAEALSVWSALPAVVALVAALAGAALRARLVGPEGSEPSAPAGETLPSARG